MSKKVAKRLTMPGQIHKAYKVLLKLINPRFVKADQAIPLKILKNAKGIAFVTVVKAGFMWSGTLGSGIVIAKLPDGTWSGPSSVGVAGMGWGALIGASVTDSVIVLNTDLAVSAFAGHGQIKFGGSLSVAAGPVGREGDGSAYLGDGGIAACYSYSHSRGLFAGVSLQGAIFMTRDSDNARFYGCPVKAYDVLKGKVLPPEFEDLKKLWDVLATINQTNSYADLAKSGASGFRDSSAVSLSSSTATSRGQKFDDDDDDDDDLPRASIVGGNGSSAGGFAWGQDEDDDRLAKAIMATTVTEKSEDLEPGWVKVTGEGGQPYYWHEPSGKTQWEAPIRASVAKMPPPPPPPPAKEDPDALPPGWTAVTSGDGKVYYWNEQTNVTQWDRPVKQISASVSMPSIPPRRSLTANPSSSTLQTQSRPVASTTNHTLTSTVSAPAFKATPQLSTSTSFNQPRAAPQQAPVASGRPAAPAAPTNRPPAPAVPTNRPALPARPQSSRNAFDSL